ncbi:MAG TPA: site-specific DNA-methyltransferase [Clostridia bacterium]|nr:MAG: DNA adenine methyltransferase YhdJ [Firmicutes bacterium ADurb.Bin248]HOG01761.1 site-specific DNA-methyltransferase [Clostridia bacterium]HOS18695.1 site-specific DNA-methyltransferase [Clostridia bacterium]HPK14583.1 site-specific DNA-methyltransferase [Clostridia bacterium]
MERNFVVRGEAYPVGGPGRFLLGRAEELAPELMGEYEGRVRLICIDPPFGTGETFSIKPAGAKQKLIVPVYSDSLGEKAYLDMMRKVLRACHALLAADGSIYLHIDYRMSAKLRLMMDEIFGEENFLNEIIWTYKSGGRSLRHYSRKHDTILFYRKSPSVYFDIAAVGMPRGPQKRNNMKRTVDADGRVCFSIRSGGKTYTYYEDTPIYPSDVWDDIEHMHQRDPERTGFATQKPAALLRRMILASSKEGDLVADFFSGSGTTAAAASALGRHYLAVDSSPAAMGMLRRRQLEGHREGSLLKDAAGMRIEYAVVPEADIAADYAASRADGRVELTFRGFSSEWGVAYAALGAIDADGFFRPENYALLPVPGVRLTARAGAVLQVCDYAGGMKFWGIDN